MSPEARLIMRKYKLSEVGKIVSGATPRTSESKYYGGEIPWLTPADLSGYGRKYISHGSRNITQMGYDSCSTQIMPAGTVLFSSRAPIGYVAIAQNPICTNQGFKSIVPNENVNSEFLYYQLKYLRSQIQDMGSGTTFKEISAKRLGEVQVVLPELDEQKRIVARIEELFSELDKAVETLEKSKRQLAVYRQAVISTAFPEMTKENTVCLDEIANISGGITKGRNLANCEIKNLPYLRVANVQNGFLNLSEIKTIAVKTTEIEKYLLQVGDVLYTEGGDRDKLGRGTVWQGEVPNCVHQNHVFKARIDRSKAIPQYVSYWSMSSFARNYFYAKGKQSVNLASINKTVLSALLLPLPSLEEQERILAVISLRLSVCNNIENTVDAALLQAEAMRKGILKQAFDGRL